jgi:hypothetical protein
LDQSTEPTANRPSLNTKQDCLRIVDTFRNWSRLLELASNFKSAHQNYDAIPRQWNRHHCNSASCQDCPYLASPSCLGELQS